MLHDLRPFASEIVIAHGSTAKGFGLKTLVGTAAGTGALRFVFRLRDHTIKRSRRDVVPVHHADMAQWEAGIRSTLPCDAAIAALKDHTGLAAGRKQPFMAAVVGHESDVLVRQSRRHVVPALARIGTVEGALASGHKDLAIWRHGHAANINRIRSQWGGLPSRAVILRNQHAGAGRD